MTYEEIIQALRICFRDLDDGAACPNCPLYGNENCLAEVMGGAANLLEWLSGANAHLYEELRWKDKVIALAQREQAKAEAERDALREKVPQWISVEERLPIDRIKKYLVAFRDLGGPIVDMARYFPSNGWTCNNWDVPQKLITHWMPLPGAPGEGEKV